MTAAGWYPDPSTGQQRWFDGTAWGPAAPPPASPPPPASEPRFTINYGFALLAVFSLIGTLMFGIPLLSQAGEEHGDVSATMGVLWLLWGGMWTVIWAAFAFQHTLRGKLRR